MKIDGLVKSPTSALRFILRHCSVLKVRLIPQDLRALNLDLLTKPSEFEPSISRQIFKVRKCFPRKGLLLTGEYGIVRKHRI